MSKFSPEEQQKIEKLVEMAQAGDSEAFGEIYEIFLQPLYRYVFYRVPEEEAEDLLENIFLKVWQNLKKYRCRDNNFNAWIFRVAHNMIADFYRGRKETTLELDVNLADEDRIHSPLRFTQNKLHSEYLKKALANLSENYRQIVVLKFINELSNPEIAEVLGKSEGALRILQFRALKALREELTKMGLEL
jgi:RNA polymerase sigma-70 factor (ECF subfamily)